MEKNTLSVLGTRTSRNKDIFHKVMQVKSLEIHFVFEKTKEYYNRCRKAGLPVPKIVNSGIIDKKSFFIDMEHKGYPLIDFFSKSSKNNIKLLKSCIKIISKAKKNKICIDPHPKNFVINDSGKTWFVDIYPPYSKVYNKTRNLTSRKKEANLVSKNLMFFNPSMLGYHFTGDIIKSHGHLMSIIPEVFDLLKLYDLIPKSITFSYFLRKAKNIMNLEIIREKKNIFLM